MSANSAVPANFTTDYSSLFPFLASFNSESGGASVEAHERAESISAGTIVLRARNALVAESRQLACNAAKRTPRSA